MNEIFISDFILTLCRFECHIDISASDVYCVAPELPPSSDTLDKIGLFYLRGELYHITFSDNLIGCSDSVEFSEL